MDGRTRTKSMNTFIDISDPAKEYFQTANTGVGGLQDPSTTLLPIYQLQSVTFRKTTVLIFISMKTSNGDIPTQSLLAPLSFLPPSPSQLQQLLIFSESPVPEWKKLAMLAKFTLLYSHYMCCSQLVHLFCSDGNAPLCSTTDLVNIWINSDWSWKIMSSDVSC